MARSYTVIWDRVKANPDKGVPVDVLYPFVSRVYRAVKNEKYYDRDYRARMIALGQTGILYMHVADHPTDDKYKRVTFLLRQYATINIADSYYLRKYPPSVNLVTALGLESLEPIIMEGKRK